MRMVNIGDLLINLILLTRILTLSYSIEYLNEYNTGKFESRESPEMTRQFKTRCTRRYSPGVCANHVSPVWTFVFQEQNCTERLGCASYFRTNRFKSYAICMKHCQGLIDVYLQMFEGDEGKNRSVLLRKGQKPKSTFKGIQGRKFGAEYYSLDASNDAEYLAPDYERGENETHTVVYRDLGDNYEIFPPDVDRETGQIMSQYDLLHP